MAETPTPPTDVQVGASQIVKVPRSRNIATRTAKANTLIAEAAKLKDNDRDLRKCRALAKVRDENRQPIIDPETGKAKRKPCPNFAMKGGFVCAMHGGKAPQVKKKAQKRLLAMVEPSLIRLEALIQQEQHLPTALGAIKTVLERAGTEQPLGPTATKAEEKDTRPIINIGFVGGVPSKVMVEQKAIPAEVTEVIEPER